MKRLYALCFALLLLLCGCGKAEAPNTSGEIAYRAKFIRTAWVEAEAVDYRYLDSTESLTTFAQSLDDYRKDAFAEAVSGYDGSFFDSHTLLLAYFSESSGSITHELSGISVNGKSLDIRIKRIVPEVITADMAGHFLLVELMQDLSGMAVRISFD